MSTVPPATQSKMTHFECVKYLVKEPTKYFATTAASGYIAGFTVKTIMNIFSIREVPTLENSHIAGKQIAVWYPLFNTIFMSINTAAKCTAPNLEGRSVSFFLFNLMASSFLSSAAMTSVFGFDQNEWSKVSTGALMIMCLCASKMHADIKAPDATQKKETPLPTTQANAKV